jgi:hypothetical protein
LEEKEKHDSVECGESRSQFRPENHLKAEPTSIVGRRTREIGIRIANPDRTTHVLITPDNSHVNDTNKTAALTFCAISHTLLEKWLNLIRLANSNSWCLRRFSGCATMRMA